MSRNVVRVDEATIFELLTVASLLLVALFGALIAYQAYRGYRRNDARSMLYLALGLFLLTVSPFLLNIAVTTLIDPERVVIALLENVSRLFGLVAITYSLYGHH